MTLNYYRNCFMCWWIMCVFDSENKTCSADAFQCPDSHKCVPQRWVCDGDRDCPDGADESVKAGCGEWSNTSLAFVQILWKSLLLNMFVCIIVSCFCSVFNNTCKAGEFMCQNRQCIPKHFVCDHDNDCGDGSDESQECGAFMILSNKIIMRWLAYN